MKEGEPYLFMREGVSRQGRSAIGRGVAPSASRQIDLSSKAKHDNVGFSHAHMLLLFAIFNKQYLLACTCHPPYPKRRGSYRQHLGGVMSKIKVAVFGLNQGARIARLFKENDEVELTAVAGFGQQAIDGNEYHHAYQDAQRAEVVVHRCDGNLRALFLEAQIHLFCCWMIGGGIDGIKNDLRVLVHFRSS